MKDADQIVICHPDRAKAQGLRDGLAGVRNRIVEYRAYEYSRLALQAAKAVPAPCAIIFGFEPGRDNGPEMIPALRNAANVPIICIGPADPMLEELALRLGADDYIHEGKSPRLIAARLDALARRYDENGMNAAFNDAVKKNRIAVGELVLQPLEHTCSWQGKPVSLTYGEYKMVKLFAQTAGRVLSRGQIEQHVYDNGVHVDDRTIDSHVKRIRRKFRAVSKDGTHPFHTIYGQGYKLGEPITATSLQMPKPGQIPAKAATLR